MVVDVDLGVKKEAKLGLGGTPGSTDESIEVRPKHGAGVVEGIHRIESPTLELPES